MSETEHTDQHWFWTENWQSGERETSAAIAAGETTVYGSDQDFLAVLDEIDATAYQGHDEITQLRAAINDLHQPVSIYIECEHVHTADEPGVHHVAEVGASSATRAVSARSAASAA